MTLGIMQPYFFPYIGYWQLFNAVDTFVVLDDVNYIKRGFINSNYILVNGNLHKFTIPLEKASQNKLIMETKLSFSDKDREKFLKTIAMSYSKAPCFHSFYDVLEKIVYYQTDDLTRYIVNSLVFVKEYLGISTEILISSEIEKNNLLKAERRIIEINKQLKSDVYINPIGGQNLYDRKHFEDAGIDLKFIKLLEYRYRQFKEEFNSNLSFIDVLMFNTKEEVNFLLEQYELF